MTKSQIVEILMKTDWSKLSKFTPADAADEILALHRSEFPMAELVDTGIDVPSKNDLAIEIIARYSTQTGRGVGIERRGFIKGATWAIDEIIKRNK